MQLDCPRCLRVVEYTSERPSFCGFCGQPLSTSQQGSTAAYDPNATGSLSANPPRASNAPPERIGGYRLGRILGSGGMGTVHEAEDPTTGHGVAIKLIAPSEFARSEEAVERFRREGRLASTIAHPRCVFVLAADEEDGQPFIVMEKMPGPTLKDLVQDRGALPPEEAIAKILDVIEGLEEAHHLQVIHRDVKPSNCFLDEAGRVKVGDFGLSKSLSGDTDLTQTGGFVGTRPFASPEQHKGEPVDARTDVYSVAATLYCLLTGRAPFHGLDGAAIAARVASEPPPSMRTIRPSLPRPLDRVVLKGLERDRDRRWQNLDEFRAALLKQIPGRLTMGGVGMRIAANILDWAVLFLFGIAVTIPILPLEGDSPTGFIRFGGLALDFCYFLYFAISECAWRCTLGKWLLGLRVLNATHSDSPGVFRIVVRSLLYFLMLTGGDVGLEFVSAWAQFDPAVMVELAPRQGWLELSTFLWSGIGCVLIALPMRSRNGYRGLHDLLTGTRVAQVVSRRARPKLRVPSIPLEALSEGMPKAVGPFRVLGRILGDEEGSLYLGEEPALSRKVWLWLRNGDRPPLAPGRRQLARPTRLRWLACGRTGQRQWDAFLAPPGCPLVDLIKPDKHLSWQDARPLLEQLAEELVAAEADGTLPVDLGVGHVWIDSSGGLIFADMRVRMDQGGRLQQSQNPLLLWNEAARLLLEGKGSAPGEGNRPIRAPLPGHVRALFDRLAGSPAPFGDIADLQADLASSRDRPTHVTRSMRVAHAVLLCALLAIPILFSSASFPIHLGMQAQSGMEMLNDLKPEGDELEQAELKRQAAEKLSYQLNEGIPTTGRLTFLAMSLCPILGVAWALLFRAGFTYALNGISLVQSSGQRASRGRCVVRAACFWTPQVLLSLPMCLLPLGWNRVDLFANYMTVWAACTVALLILYVCYFALAVWKPTRSIHDWIAGTWLVPE